MAMEKISGMGLPIDANGNVMLVVASQAVTPIVSLGGFLIDANGFVLVPG
jgi:hypothetical protein